MSNRHAWMREPKRLTYDETVSKYGVMPMAAEILEAEYAEPSLSSAEVDAIRGHIDRERYFASVLRTIRAEQYVNDKVSYL
jgi:hypothetical protein